MIAYRMQTDPPVQRARVDRRRLPRGASVRLRSQHPVTARDDSRPRPVAARRRSERVRHLGDGPGNLFDQHDPIPAPTRPHQCAGRDGLESRGVRRRPGRAVFVAADLRRRRADDLDLEPARPRRYASQEITGTEGRIELRPAFHGECSLHLSRGDVSVTVEHRSFDAEREMEEEFDYFADCLLGDGDLYPDGRHGLQDMRIIEALHDSAERG